MNPETPPTARKESARIDLGAMRERLADGARRGGWRGLEELAETEEFNRWLRQEFPQEPWGGAIDRRRFLQLMGASLALAGLTGCTRQPEETIVPFVRQPEEFVAGERLHYATALHSGRSVTGILVETHMGRPTKIEGNPQHPASLGATDALVQASILSLYDPDRSQAVTHGGRISSWTTFFAALSGALAAEAGSGGAGLRILTETVYSPALASQLESLLRKYPGARWHQWEPAGRDDAREGARLAFGEHVDTRYDFNLADVILSLDADFTGGMPGSLRYTRELTARRRPEGTMNRLYVAECSPSPTGSMADHRLPIRASDVEALVRRLARRLGVPLGGADPDVLPPGVPEAWFQAVAADLEGHRGRSIVIAGEEQPPGVHAVVHGINQALGNHGSTVVHTDPVEARPLRQDESLRALVTDMAAGRVNLLVVLGGNPVYSAPADLGFAGALRRVALRAHLGLYEDETSELCQWHAPEAHSLEAWSDLRAHDGTVSVVQPLISPLYGGRSAHEVLSALLGRPDLQGHEILREHWRAVRQGQGEAGRPAGDFEKLWRRTLHDGVMPGTALPARQVALRQDFDPPPGRAAGERARGGIEIVFRPDPTVFDGRFANNAWLQELPKPVTQLAWENAALLSPALAERRSLANGDVVELRHRGRSLRAPVWIVPGHADDSITVHLGYGRTRAGRVGTGMGFNAGAIRTSEAPWQAADLEVVSTGERHALACTQHHHSMQGRNLVRAATLEQFAARPAFAREMGHDPPEGETLYRDPPRASEAEHAWGMVIDLNACTGCGACVVACQSENNIPVVGKEEVARGRELHWIRIDRYHEGGLDNPAMHHQPVACMHCEHAPCEPVCPVGATAHSNEGLNEMVYNRCVGTRYCSNNCPYKVRRFNFFQYSDLETPSLKLMRNPEVTVRSRGVMEKCTYCVQRINATRIHARSEGRRIGGDEVVTACQAVCPAQAIVFGDVSNRESRVASLKAGPRNYGLLTELNTRPRTTYLAKVTNPNPDLSG